MQIELPTEADPVRVIEGDCLDVLRSLPDGCVDAVITDPPYMTAEAEIEYLHAGVCERVSPTTTVGMPWGYSLDWVEAAARLKPKHWLVFAHFKMFGGLCSALERHAEIMSVFTWRKSNAPNMARPVPRMDCEFVVWAKSAKAKCEKMGEFRSLVIDVPGLAAGCMATERVLMPNSGKAAHPCQKPVAIFRPFIRRLGCSLILDPFAGSGTTGIAAALEGRRCLLIEKEPAYAAIARERVRKVLGKDGLFADV